MINESKLKEKVYNQYELLDNCIKDLFYDYTSFIISINEKIEPISHKYIFKATTNPPILNTGNKYFRLLKDLIFPLCYIEHHLSFSKKNLERITVLLERIKYEKSRETDERCLKVFQLAVYKGSFILNGISQLFIFFTYYFMIVALFSKFNNIKGFVFYCALFLYKYHNPN